MATHRLPLRRLLPEASSQEEDLINRSDTNSSKEEKEISIEDEGDTSGSSSTVLLRRESSLIQQNRVDLLRVKDELWETIANKTLPPEDSKFMMMQLEKQADEWTRRTYIGGNPTAEPVESSIIINVGLTFLPGADRPQVARYEQGILTNGPLDQKSALWRVNTAGSLLKDFNVSADLSLKEEDRTGFIAKEAIRRRTGRLIMNRDPRAFQMQQFGRRDNEQEAVTIDSKCVMIVNDLRDFRFDLEATLIEVDGVSMWGLMMNYRYLISRTDSNTTLDETRNILDTMIEDARRLCVRSPMLFRMSTRKRIINSKNTRYGMDQSDHSGFRTIQTSKGIKEIISISASYYDALDPQGRNDTNQRFIRPRFLQMLTLLLLFLNNDDLQEIAKLLETTYRIKADRTHIEMLILKVVPLLSINATVFIEALTETIEGYPLAYPAQEFRQPYYWDTFVQRISRLGYILPAGVASLGRARDSWIPKWPEQGYKSSKVFENLQYAGDRLSAFHDISPVDLHPEESFKELNVIINEKEYTLDPRDIEKITTMGTGRYNTIEVGGRARKLELEIQEIHISSALERAVSRVNNIIDEYNRHTSVEPRRRTLLSPKLKNIAFLQNVESSGRITKHIATLDQDMLTTAWKIEGRKITQNDAWRTMGRVDNRLETVVKDLERRTSELFQKNNPLAAALAEARNAVEIAQAARRRIGDEREYSDEPITTILYPNAETPGLQQIWHDYQACYDGNRQRLKVSAMMAQVTGVRWIQPDVVEISLHSHATRYFAKPLHEDFDQDDEVVEGDWAVFMGQYIMLAEADANETDAHLTTNYLRITGFEEIARSRRGANRARPAQQRRTMFIV